MAYTEAQERSAQRRLREIYNRKSRSERIKLAEKFEYGGSDASKLRVLRRITAQVVPEGRLVKINQYFSPYVTDDAPNPWDGKYPDLSLDGQFHIVSSVMYVGEMPDGYQTWSQHLNTRSDAAWQRTRAKYRIQMEKRGEPRKRVPVSPPTATEPAFSSEIEYLFAKYAKDVVRAFLPPDQGGYNLPESGKIIAIGFSLEGNKQLVKKFAETGEDGSDGIEIDIPPPEGDEYGIALMPSRRGVKQGEKVPQVWAYKYQRKLPKGKRDFIIKYVNRASGQYGIE